MPFRVVLVGFAVFLVSYLFVRAVTERLVFGQAAHANKYGTSLRFDLEWLFIGFDDLTHDQRNI